MLPLWEGACDSEEIRRRAQTKQDMCNDRQESAKAADILLRVWEDKDRKGKSWLSLTTFQRDPAPILAYCESGKG